MFQTPILDVAAGLILFFLVLSLVCTSLNEIVAQILSLREEVLWRGLCSLFQNSEAQKAEEFAGRILDHNLVDAMSPPGANPNNIPSHVFSLAVLDVIGIDGRDTTDTLATRLDAAKKAKGTELGKNVFETLKPLAVAADTSVDAFRLNIERWFDATMVHATDWYKQRLRVITICVAFGVCVALNGDTLMLAKSLWTSPQTAAKLASTAQTVSKLQPPPDVSAPATDSSGQPKLAVGADASNALSDAKLLPPELQTVRTEVFGLIGWSGHFPWQDSYDRSNEHRYPSDGWEMILKLLGLIITTIAACLGAPFWFDALSKLIALRKDGQSGKPDGATSNPPDNPVRISSDGKT